MTGRATSAVAPVAAEGRQRGWQSGRCRWRRKLRRATERRLAERTKTAEADGGRTTQNDGEAGWQRRTMDAIGRVRTTKKMAAVMAEEAAERKAERMAMTEAADAVRRTPEAAERKAEQMAMAEAADGVLRKLEVAERTTERMAEGMMERAGVLVCVCMLCMFFFINGIRRRAVAINIPPPSGYNQNPATARVPPYMLYIT